MGTGDAALERRGRVDGAVNYSAGRRARRVCELERYGPVVQRIDARTSRGVSGDQARGGTAYGYHENPDGEDAGSEQLHAKRYSLRGNMVRDRRFSATRCFG